MHAPVHPPKVYQRSSSSFYRWVALQVFCGRLVQEDDMEGTTTDMAFIRSLLVALLRTDPSDTTSYRSEKDQISAASLRSSTAHAGWHTAGIGWWERVRSAAWWLWRSPLAVAGAVLLIYGAWTLAALRAGQTATDFAFVGWWFAHQSTASTVITFGPTFHYGPAFGYDGQFCYFLALDPKNAHYYMDAPAYRYERILYPLLVRILALGQPSLIPYTLIAVNVVAITGGVLLLAYWLRRHGISPWLALVYGLSAGVSVGYQRDLTEPLAYGLVILAICCFEFSRRRALWAGLCFGLAALARETTLVFALIYIVARLVEPPHDSPNSEGCIATEIFRRMLRRNWRPAAFMLVLSVGPLLVYKLFLLLWLDSTGVPASLMPRLIPFSGLLALWPWHGDELISAQIVCVPALICLALSVWAILRRRATIPVWALLANIVLFVLMLTPSSYMDSAAATRVTTGVVVAALLAIPAFDAVTKHDRRWLAGCASAWMVYTFFNIALTAFRALARL